MVHYRWRELDFSKLYNHINDNFDTEFYNKALKQKRIIEINMKNEAYITKQITQQNITQKWSCLCYLTWSKYWLYQQRGVQNPWNHNSFAQIIQTCFKTGELPINFWRKHLFTTFPKDPYTNYHGISLLSVVANF